MATLTKEVIAKVLHLIDHTEGIQSLVDRMEGNPLFQDATAAKLLLPALDFCIYYDPKDADKAVTILDRLTESGLKGRLFDESALAKFEDTPTLYKRATIKFFVITNNIASGDSSDIMKRKTELIMTDIRKSDSSVVPVWWVAKNDLNDDAFGALFGLGSVMGLDPHSTYFARKANMLRNDNANKAKKSAYEKENIEKLRGYLEKMLAEIDRNGPYQIKVPELERTAGATAQPNNAPMAFTVDIRFWQELAAGFGARRQQQAWATGTVAHDGPETMDTQRSSYQTDGAYSTSSSDNSSHQSSGPSENLVIAQQATDAHEDDSYRPTSLPTVGQPIALKS